MAWTAFATTCDVRVDGVTCGNRSPENSTWPTCFYCGVHVCPEHMVNNTLTEVHGDNADNTAAVSRQCHCLECG